MEAEIKLAVKVLNRGGIVIFPTDTAFGIGCRMDNKQTIDRLFTIRKRSRTQATPVLVSSKDMALNYFSTPSPIVRRLMDSYWPGALTIVAPCKKNLVYEPIRGGGETMGLRMPNHSTILAVITAVGVPILGPSANFHGEQTPYRVKDLNPRLIQLVDYVLPGECNLKKASTVIDTTTSPPAILRQGAVYIDEKDII